MAIGLIAEPAYCQGKLEAKYLASIAGIPIGRGAWTIEVGENHYAAAASGQVIGLFKIVANGQGAVAVEGTIDAVHGLMPTSYSAEVKDDEADDLVHMAFAGGTVSELSAQPPYPPSADRIEIRDVDRRGVLDPMSAGLIPAPAEGELLAPSACQRTLAIFDGRQRFDLVLSFRRLDQVKAEKGYRGPVVVCGVIYQPISGHRPSRAAIKFLMATRDMEMWLAPIAGTRILVPFRISVPTLIGTAVLQAREFVAVAGPPHESSAIPKIP